MSLEHKAPGTPNSVRLNMTDRATCFHSQGQYQGTVKDKETVCSTVKDKETVCDIAETRGARHEFN